MLETQSFNQIESHVYHKYKYIHAATVSTQVSSWMDNNQVGKQYSNG